MEFKGCFNGGLGMRFHGSLGEVWSCIFQLDLGSFLTGLGLVFDDEKTALICMAVFAAFLAAF